MHQLALDLDHDDDQAAIESRAASLAERGRLLLQLYLADESWPEYVQAISLLAEFESVRPEFLADAFAGALDAFDEADPTPTATAARWALAAKARRLRAADGLSDVLKARAAHLLGRCLSGSSETGPQAEAVEALEDAARRYETLGPDGAIGAGRARLDLARHHWDCGNLDRFQAPYMEGRARLEALGRSFIASAMESPFVRWVYYAGWVLGARAQMPEWLLHDGAEVALHQPGRIAEAWYAMLLVMPYPIFFQRAAEHNVARLQAEGATARPALAEARVLEGMVKAQSFDFDGAARAFEHAVELYAKLGKKHADLHARSLMDIGTVQRLAGRFEPSAAAYARASAAFEKIHGMGHEDTTKSLGLSVLMYLRSGDLARASAAVDRVMTLLRDDEAFAKWHEELGALQRAGTRPLAQACWLVAGALGRPGDQRDLHARCPEYIKGTLHSQADDLVTRGRYREAVAMLRDPPADVVQAEAGVRPPGTSDAPLLPGAMVAIRRGKALYDVGCYEEAFAAANGAVAILDDSPVNRVMVPMVRRAELKGATLLAEALLRRGLVREARAMSERAFRLQCLIPKWSRISRYAISNIWRRPNRRFINVWLPGDAIAWWVLTASPAAEVHARCLEADGEGDAALSVLGTAAREAGRFLGRDHPRMIRLRRLLGSAAFRTGQFQVARAHLEGAHEAALRALGAEHPLSAEIELTLADLDVAQGRHAAARGRYAHVLAVTDECLFDSHINHVRARSGTALALSREGRTKEALRPMREAMDRLVARITEASAGATTPERLALIASTHWALANWLEVSAAAGVLGYDEVLRLRGLEGRLMAADRAAWKQGSEKARAVHGRLREAQGRLARIVHAAPHYGWDRLAWRRDVARQAAACDDLTRDLDRLSHSYVKAHRAITRVDARKLRTALKKGEVLVDFLAAGGRYTAWVVPRAGEPVRVELGDAQRTEGALEAFVAAARRAEGEDDAVLREAGALARATFWQPIAAVLPANADVVYVVPDGWVAAVPLAALPGTSPESVLAEELLLVHLSSPHDLLAPPGSLPRGRGLLAMGSVDYESAEKTREGGPVVTGRPLTDLPRGMRRYSPLPATAAEIVQVREGMARSPRFKGAAVLLEGEQATEGRLRSHATGKAVIHLATHAFVREGLDGSLRVPQGDVYRLEPGLEVCAHRFDPMLVSGVVLAGANTRVTEGEDDGVLTALEATHLDLTDTHLVVLSACESARGVEQAAQGTLGLVRGFGLAGARNVIGSLWKVADEQTALLMRDFYSRWLSRPSTRPAAALRDAALALRRGDLGAAARAPRHWAAFVAYGPLR
jgi:CHAT domain-containing protein